MSDSEDVVSVGSEDVEYQEHAQGEEPESQQVRQQLCRSLCLLHPCSSNARPPVPLLHRFTNHAYHLANHDTQQRAGVPT